MQAAHSVATMNGNSHKSQQQARSKRSSLLFTQNAQTLSRSTNLHQQMQIHQQQQHYRHHMAFATLRGRSSKSAGPYYDAPMLINPQERIMSPTMTFFSPHQRAMIPSFEQAPSMMAAPNHVMESSRHSAVYMASAASKPLCRCRVMYLGSSVPHLTKNGLHGIQEPLKHLYPDDQFNSTKLKMQSKLKSDCEGPKLSPETIDISHLGSSLGIDSWLSVWSNGMLLENVDEFGRQVKRFFSIESLHYCAAVRFFDTTNLMSQDQRRQEQQEDLNNNNNNTCDTTSTEATNGTTEAEIAPESSAQKITETATRQTSPKKSMVRFLPLDAPLFQCPGMIDANHPPVFAAIMRRTTGIKVLECHAFICRRDAAANALVRCCTHAYADFLSAKRLSVELGVQLAPNSTYQKGMSLSSTTRRKANPAANGYQNSQDSQQETSTASSSNNRQQMSASSTANTTSNETDNSLEASTTSEDNYAIISKRSGAHKFQHAADTSGTTRKLGDTNQTKRGKRRSSKSPGKSKLGSSKSLYDDFMPNELPGAPSHKGSLHTSRHPSQRQMSDIEKLSQSLDFLRMNGGQCFDGDTLNCVPVDQDDTVEYSVVRNKRFSKSMQNLDGPFQFSAPIVADTKSPSRSRWVRRTEPAANGTNRKATSYQDMRKDSMSSSGGQECSSLESCRNQEAHIYAPCNSETTPSMENSNPGAGLGLTHAQVHDHRYQRGRHGTVADGSTITMMSQQRILAPSHKCKGKKSSARRREQSCPPSKCHQRRQELERTYESVIPMSAGLVPLAATSSHQQQPQLPPQALNTNGRPTYYHYGPPAAPNNYHTVMTPAHHHPIYMPPLLLQYPGYHPQPTYARQAAAAHIYELLPSNSGASHYGLYNHLSDIQSNSALPPQSQLNKRTKSSAAKSSLAKFRCLSPPVNFLGGSQAHGCDNNKTNEPASTNAETASAAARRLSMDEEDQTSKLKRADEEARSASSVVGEELDIVTAPPGFIAATTGTSTAASVTRQKKMSWIKRLSLTMSAASSGNGAIAAAAEAGTSNLCTNPDGAAGLSQRQPTKRRSGLFSGSLTLGRGKQQHPKLITGS